MEDPKVQALARVPLFSGLSVASSPRSRRLPRNDAPKSVTS